MTTDEAIYIVYEINLSKKELMCYNMPYGKVVYAKSRST